jgi:hypothetical protein
VEIVAVLTDSDLWLAAGPWKEQVETPFVLGFINDGKEGFSVDRLCCACDAVSRMRFDPAGLEANIYYTAREACRHGLPVKLIEQLI